MTDPNPEYDIFERITVTAYEKHFPNKPVKVNKYKHKLSPWITAGLIKSIEYLARRLLQTNSINTLQKLAQNLLVQLIHRIRFRFMTI